MAFSDAQRQWLQGLLVRAGPVPAAPGGADRDDAEAPLLGAEGGASGRDRTVRSQVDKLRGIAERQPATPFKGDIYRAVPTSRADSFNDHSYSRGGRYNKMGQPALYTSPSVADIQAEAKNYGTPADPTGIEGSSIVRASFEGDLLDARTLPDVSPDALTEPYGLKGQGKTLLTKLTGEDPYTMPRTVADVAQTRNLRGVLAPANEGNTNIPLFPEKNPAAGDGALHDNLAYKGQQDVAGGVIQPERVAAAKPNLPDTAPNRNTGPTEVAGDAAAHGRASGARYGAAGAAVMTLGQDALEGHFNAEDAKTLAVNTAEGAAIGQADTVLAGQIAKNMAGAAAAEAEIAGVRTAAGLASAGTIGAVVGGGVAAWHDADKVKDGSMTAGQATADVAVSAGVGLGAGLAGAAAGAAVGSIVPVAGTAVGAVVGFGVGMAASVITTLAAEKSGLADKAREELGELLTENVEQPLQRVWHAGSDASAAVGSAAKSVAGGVSHAVQDAGHAVSDAAKKAAKAAAGEAEKTAKGVAHAASDAVKKAEAAAKSVAGEAEKTAKGVAHAASDAVKKAEAAAKAVAGEAEKTAKGVAHAASEAVKKAEAAAKSVAGEAEKTAKGVAHAASDAVKKAEAAAKAVAGEAEKTAKGVAHAASEAVQQAEKTAKAAAADAEKAAKGVAQAASSAVDKAEKAAAAAKDALGSAISSIF